MKEILASLHQAVLDYDSQAAASLARAAVEAGIAPLAALEALTEAIRVVGEGFGCGELWLPDLVGASEAMLAATPILEAEIARQGAVRDSLGTVVIGTVQGDLHNIGKAMVATLLTAEGFRVHDVGINVSADQFLQAIQRYKPDIVAMSALMTTTISQQRLVIERLHEAGLRDRIKVMVGGGGVTQQFADSIGADGYEPTAPGAAKLARRLLGLS
jgi:corrinoid protein of di/trimethylamine methyltransferase